MVAQTKPYTVDEFEAFIALPENADRLFELIDGEIVEKVPTQKHGVITGNVFGFLWLYSRERGTGRVAQDVRHRMPDDPHNARLPDVAYYADDSKPLVERGPVPYFPDLAVEVKSPDDSIPKMRLKAAYYLKNGTKLVWLIYPEKKLVEVYRADGSIDILTEADTLADDELLPGFHLAVKDIFPA